MFFFTKDNMTFFQRRPGKRVLFAGVSVLLFLLINPLAAKAQNPLKQIYSRAWKAYQGGQYRKAASLFEQIMGGSGDPEKMVWCFKTAAEIEPDYTEAHENLCKAYFQLGEYDKAERSCQRALQLEPNRGSAQMTAAWLYLKGLEEPGKAVFYFQKVLEKAQSPQVYFALGLAHAMNGDHADVLQVVTTLRGMGEDALAAELENTIRIRYDPKKLSTYTTYEKRQKGELVQTPKKEPAEPLGEPAVPSGDIGQMKVRLRGTLTPPGGMPAKKNSNAYPTEW